MTPNWAGPVGMSGSPRTATRVTPGAICLSSSSHFPLMLYSKSMKPVALPRNAITPSVVNRHGRMLETNRAMDQRHDRLARRLEVAVTHGDAGFLVRAGEEFRHRVLAVIDQGFVNPAVT